jgi:hypothetical protein
MRFVASFFFTCFLLVFSFSIFFCSSPMPFMVLGGVCGGGGGGAPAVVGGSRSSSSLAGSSIWSSGPASTLERGHQSSSTRDDPGRRAWMARRTLPAFKHTSIERKSSSAPRIRHSDNPQLPAVPQNTHTSSASRSHAHRPTHPSHRPTFPTHLPAWRSDLSCAWSSGCRARRGCGQTTPNHPNHPTWLC